MADYWIKLYIEILDDPKMATIPDRVWRRTVELFLVAKKLNKNGHLPETRQIAWLLRMSDDELAHDMTQIASTGIIVQELGGWFIPNFVKRQSAVGGAERVAQFRKREQKQEYYEDVTNLKRNVTQSTEIRDQSTEAERATAAFRELTRVYEIELGILTPHIIDQIKDAESTYPKEWIIEAMQKAAQQNVRTWAYSLGILKRWQREGKNNNGRKNHTQTVEMINGPDLERES